MIVADTCTIIWSTITPNLLSKQAKEAIELAGKIQGIYFCEISLWEIAMLVKKKRLILNSSYQEFIQLIVESQAFKFIGITPRIAELANNLPKEINHDPADKIIAATSHVLNLPLVTADKNLRKSNYIQTIW